MNYKKLKMIGVLFLFSFLSGCSMTKTNSNYLEWSQNYKKEYPNGFCALAVSTYHISLYGKYPETWTGHPTSFECEATIQGAQTAALRRCYYGCEIAYDISIETKKIINYYEDYNLRRHQAQRKRYAQEAEAKNTAKVENYSKQCDGFGFDKGTADYSNCMLQLKIADNLTDQIKESSDAQTKELQKIRQQEALNSLNRSLQNLNQSTRKSSVVCNVTITGFICN